MKIIDNKNTEHKINLKDILSVDYYHENKTPYLLIKLKDRELNICYADYFKDIYEYCLKHNVSFNLK